MICTVIRFFYAFGKCLNGNIWVSSKKVWIIVFTLRVCYISY